LKLEPDLDPEPEKLSEHGEGQIYCWIISLNVSINLPKFAV